MLWAMKNLPTIGIIGGTGKMGSFFRHFFEKEGFEVLIAGRKTLISYRELCEKSDIVFVSVPISETTHVIKKILLWLKKDALLSDFTSLKQASTKAMKKRLGPYLGIHPLFGPLITSLEGQVIVFCPGEIKSTKIEFLKTLFEKNGARVIILKPEEHDKQMAFIQALIHFINIGLGITLSKPEIKINSELSTPLFRLQSLIIGRIFGQPASLYSDISMENPQAKKVINEYLKQAQNLSILISKKDKDRFSKIFSKTEQTLGPFIKVAEQKTTDILNIIDKQPIKSNISRLKINSEDIKVAFLGPEGTYSNLVTNKIFPKAKTLLATKTIDEVFSRVNSGEVDFGIVPSENSIEGSVKETVDCLIDYPLEIVANYNLPINHFLLSKSNKITNIKVIKSHPQALGQCRNWIKVNLPWAKVENALSTVAAIEGSSDQTAFIASEQAAKKYKLNILAKNIGDNKNNQTEFYVISQQKNNLIPNKAILLLSVYDRVGILKDILEVFALNNLNLTRILSIPSGSKMGDYLFLIDVEIKSKLKNYKKALVQLKQYCPMIRTLGEV